MNHTLIRLIALAVLLLSLTGSGYISVLLGASAGQHKLVYSDTAEEGDPPQVALGIAMGAFRGIFVNFLWLRANDLKDEGKYYEAVELARAITTLQPRFPRVWAFHAWNMSYNISVTTHTPEERWRWVSAGVNLLRDEGIVYNPNDMLLHKELAWIFNHKIGGYTDDNNLFYKRKLAEEWTIVMGPPPTLDLVDSEPGEAQAIFADWLMGFVDAPETLAAVRDSSPEAAELVQALSSQLTADPAFNVVRRYTYLSLVQPSARRPLLEQGFSEKQTAMLALMDDPRFDEAFDVLIRHMRKRLIVDEYHMEPARMVRYTNKYGPIDWRSPFAHSLYWSARGVERGVARASQQNMEDFDFVNSDRLVIQSVQGLYRYGDLYFDFLDYAAGNPGAYYQGTPNAYFVFTYGDLLDEVDSRAGIFDERERRAYSMYSAGYENFMRDAIRFFYRRGQDSLAEEFQERLRTFPYRNLNDPEFNDRVTLPLEEFVRAEVFDEDRITSPYVMVSEFQGAIQGAYLALLSGNPEEFERSYEYAIQVHRYFNEEQYRELRDAGGGNRLTLVDADFFLASGISFAQMLGRLGLEDAESIYDRAPQILQQYAYDLVQDRFRPAFEADPDAFARAFDEVFPEPEGMEEFRVQLEAKLAARQQRGPDGIELE